MRNLGAALRDKRKPLSAEQRQHTQELLDRGRMFVDVYTLKVSPPNARVLVDGRAPEFEADGTLLLGFGPHTLEASARGMVVRSLPINVRGGERKDLSVTLEPMAALVPRLPDPAAAQVTTTAQPSPERPSNGAAAAWLWASGGTALLAGGAGIYWILRNSELNSCRKPFTGYSCTNESTVRAEWYLGLGTTVGLGAAALTMALIGILSWDSGTSPATAHSALGCSVSPLGIACAGSF